VTDRGNDIRREWIRSRVLSEAWTLGFPVQGMRSFIGRVFDWFRRNNISFGLFASWPTGSKRDPVGTRAGLLAIDSPTRTVVVGWARVTRRDLQRLAREDRAVRVRVFGWLRIAEDVDTELTARALESVRVIGVSRVPNAVRAQLTDRAA
jgi:hypothetical protein